MISCAAAAAALIAALPASDPLGAASVVVARLNDVIYSYPVAGTSDHAYVARFALKRQLAGPKLQGQEIASMVSAETPADTMALALRRDGVGRLWARRNWQACRD